MSLIHELIKPIIIERALVGLTGGGATKLDGIVTLGLALSPVPRAQFVIAGDLYVYQLRSGTDAESSPGIIRPDDYAGTTNEKVWERLSFGGGLLAANDLSDVASTTTSRTNLDVYSKSDVDAAIAAIPGGGDLVSTNNLSDVASATTARSNLGAASASSLATLTSTVSSLSGAVAVNTSDITTNVNNILLRLIASNNLSDLANAGTARTNLGLAIGSNVEAWSANLDAWSALATSAKLTTASNLSDLANAGTARTNLGLVIGTNVEAWSANLDSWSALATSAKLTTASNLSDLANAGTARTNLGLAIGTDVAAQGLFATAQAAITNLKKTNLVFIIDGGGVVITTGSKGLIRVPAAMTITGWEMFADASGSIVVDVKKATYSGLPTTTSITASAIPTLSSAQKNTDSTLTGWTTAVADGDWLEFVVNSATTVQRVTLAIFGTRT